jgi:hypothetical protein
MRSARAAPRRRRSRPRRNLKGREALSPSGSKTARKGLGLSPMKVVTSCDLILVKHSDAVSVANGANRHWCRDKPCLTFQQLVLLRCV